MPRFAVAIAVLFSLAPVAFVAHADDAPVNVMFIVDASGSMKTAVGKESRMAAAKRSLKGSLDSIPEGARLGLTLYGHRRAKDCTDIELASPIGADDAATLAKKIVALQPKGETPIAEALRQATRSFTAFRGQTNRIVLVTDGIEECRGDPCAAARAIKNAGLDLKVDVVGFTLNAAQRRTVQCVADITGGKYYDAQNAASLTTALAEVRDVVEAAPAKPSGFDLLAAKNGGALLAAPTDKWSATIDGDERYVWGLEANSESVYGFKDDRPATFDTFAVFIDRTDKFNPKTLELLAGDDSPTGEFQAVATCTFENVKLLRSLYQECKFDPVTARFFKVRVVESFKVKDARTWISEFRLIGTLADASAKAAPSPKTVSPSGIDLLAKKNGGALLAAPTDKWSATIDGDERYVWGLEADSESVYGFKDDRPATFDTFAVFVDRTDKFNPQSLELLAGNNGPTGEFRTIATCKFENVKLLRSLYQECKFDPVTARFFKVRVVESFKEKDARIWVSEFKLTGTLGEPVKAAAASAKPAMDGAVNLLAARAGGQLLAAPTDKWQATIDGDETYVWGLDADAEGVYGFKDDRPATFDTFAVYIDRTEKFNPQTLELLAGDDGATGAFRPVAACTFENVKLLRSLYQECSFEPVTARYVKVRVAKSFKDKDARVYVSEFKLMGKLEAAAKAAPAAAKPATSGAIDLLSPKNGGSLLAAPTDKWAATVDGKENYVWGLEANAEGVYGFKGDKPATFDTFAVFIGKEERFNPKTLEILAGDESATGKFRSVTTCSFQNVKLMRSPYQECTFEPVTAKFVKVRVVSSFKDKDARIYASEFKLMGRLGE